MALPTLTNHCSTTVHVLYLDKRHSREITYQVPGSLSPYAARLISVGQRVGGAWGQGYHLPAYAT